MGLRRARIEVAIDELALAGVKPSDPRVARAVEQATRQALAGRPAARQRRPGRDRARRRRRRLPESAMSDAKQKAPKTHKPPTRADATPRAIRRAHRAGEHRRGAALVEAGKGPGAPLAPAARRRLDAHLGHRFSALRVHTGDFAARTARALDANAFTVGRDVFFSAGMYAPDEPAGYARLAHEAAHTMQQRSPTATVAQDRLEAEADRAVLAGSTAGLSATSPLIQLEPTWPRRTTGAGMLREAEKILATTRDPQSTDELTRLWSQVGSNFPATQTAGTIARRVWTNLFLRHFTEPDPRGGVESSAPALLLLEDLRVGRRPTFLRLHRLRRAAARGDAERPRRCLRRGDGAGDQDRERPADDPRLGDPRRAAGAEPDLAPDAGAPAEHAAVPLAADGRRRGDVTRRQISPRTRSSKGRRPRSLPCSTSRRRQKFFLDAAKSAWTYEDIVSDQLGTRFFFQHGTKINRMSAAAREPAMLAALTSFFTEIGVVDDQDAVDKQAKADGLPLKEAYEANKTTEARERKAHPDLFTRPKEAQ